MTKVLITGISGFVGRCLADLLSRNGSNRIVGLDRSHPDQKDPQFPVGVSFHSQDILDADGMKALIRDVSPDVVFHIAGMAQVHASWTLRKETIETNFLGAFHLLEACRALDRFPKVLLVGSAECYGVVPETDQPITEKGGLEASSPYAVSKIAQEVLGTQYAKAEHLPVFLSRSFNHTGPGQKESFVCSAFAKQIAMAELGLSEAEIRVGNLAPRRDFSDVRDVCRAYIAIVERGVAGVPYNVCSGKAVTIEEVLHILLSHSSKKFRVVIDPERFRPVDMPLLLGSAEKLQRETGWQPEYDLATTLLDLLNDWRGRLAPIEIKDRFERS